MAVQRHIPHDDDCSPPPSSPGAAEGLPWDRGWSTHGYETITSAFSPKHTRAGCVRVGKSYSPSQMRRGETLVPERRGWNGTGHTQGVGRVARTFLRKVPGLPEEGGGSRLTFGHRGEEGRVAETLTVPLRHLGLAFLLLHLALPAEAHLVEAPAGVEEVSNGADNNARRAGRRRGGRGNLCSSKTRGSSLSC